MGLETDLSAHDYELALKTLLGVEQTKAIIQQEYEKVDKLAEQYFFSNSGLTSKTTGGAVAPCEQRRCL